MDKKKRYLKYLPVAIGVALALLVAIGLYLVRDIFQKPVQGKKQIQQVSVVQPPPPPPPPEQKPPEPEVKEEKIEELEPEPEPEPEEQAEEPPPGEQLGVDSDGSAGSDAFGLVGKKGGHGLIGGGGGNTAIYLAQQIKKEMEAQLHRYLEEQGKARTTSYSAVVHVWIGEDGAISRIELANSSGDSDVDGQLKTGLDKFRANHRFPSTLPAKLQPLKFKIRS